MIYRISYNKNDPDDYVIHEPKTEKTGFLLIVYGKKERGTLYRMEYGIADKEYSDVNDMDTPTQEYILRRILSDTIKKWE